jgi:hypothetical protein
MSHEFKKGLSCVTGVKRLADRLDAKLEEVGVTIWNNSPNNNGQDFNAFLGQYGDVPVLVELHFGDDRSVPYVIVRYIVSRQQIVRIHSTGYVDSDIVADFTLLG